MLTSLSLVLRESFFVEDDLSQASVIWNSRTRWIFCELETADYVLKKKERKRKIKPSCARVDRHTVSVRSRKSRIFPLALKPETVNESRSPLGSSARSSRRVELHFVICASSLVQYALVTCARRVFMRVPHATHTHTHVHTYTQTQHVQIGDTLVHTQ